MERKVKKNFILCCLLVLAVNGFTGDYQGSGFIIVDSQTNIAYYSVGRTTVNKKSSLFNNDDICNVQINDISKKINKYIFPDNDTYKILLFFFEEKIDRKDGKKIFHSNNRYYGADSNPNWVENNNNISSESVSKNLLIKTKNPSTKEIQFWLCDKTGNNLKSIYKYTEKDFVRFYVDAKFQKIIFIKSVENGNAVTEIDY